MISDAAPSTQRYKQRDAETHSVSLLCPSVSLCVCVCACVFGSLLLFLLLSLLLLLLGSVQRRYHGLFSSESCVYAVIASSIDQFLNSFFPSLADFLTYERFAKEAASSKKVQLLRSELGFARCPLSTQLQSSESCSERRCCGCCCLRSPQGSRLNNRHESHSHPSKRHFTWSNACRTVERGGVEILSYANSVAFQPPAFDNNDIE